MNITYNRDDEHKHQKDIRAGLVSYNEKFTGKRPIESFNVYIHDNEAFVGGLKCEMGWDWVFISELHYNNADVLANIMNVVYGQFRSKAVGVTFESYIDTRVNDLIGAGFEVKGTMEDMPSGESMRILINTSMKEMDMDGSFTVMSGPEANESYDKLLSESIKEYKENNGIDETQTDISYVAFDEDKLIGGVTGYIMQDYLYISRLWVDEAYRGQRIASELMDLIEKEAREKGTPKSHLGTCTFQAKGLYEKRGYDVKMIIENCPKGFEDYIMVKNL